MNFDEADIASLRESVEYLSQLRLKIEANGTFIVDGSDIERIDTASQYLNVFRMLVSFDVRVKRVQVKTKTSGFKKVNMGFYHELTRFFQKQKEAFVKYDTVYHYMKKHFPLLPERKFNVYIYDRRQWERVGYSYDSKTRIFTVVHKS